MRHFATALSVVLLAGVATPAGATVDVVTTTEGLAAIAREVGGDRVKVTALSRGIQDPHFVDANPSLAVKLRNADLLAASAGDPVPERRHPARRSPPTHRGELRLPVGPPDRPGRSEPG
jgi:ABC-type Zn uptake system ZnuABC Zn-binding protein ZnuA